MGQWVNTAQIDHLTLRPWPLTLEIMAPAADAGRRPPFVYQGWFEVRRPCFSKIWRTMCISINGPADPDLWRFNLETGMRVASKVRNLSSENPPSILGTLGLWVLELFAMYATDGQTDGRTKATFMPLPYGRMHNNLKFWGCNKSSPKLESYC